MSRLRLHQGKRTYHLRTFACPVCGALVHAGKSGITTNVTHIKTMWCYRCRAEQDFTQLDEHQPRRTYV